MDNSIYGDDTPRLKINHHTGAVVLSHTGTPVVINGSGEELRQCSSHSGTCWEKVQKERTTSTQGTVVKSSTQVKPVVTLPPVRRASLREKVIGRAIGYFESNGYSAVLQSLPQCEFRQHLEACSALVTGVKRVNPNVVSERFVTTVLNLNKLLLDPQVAVTQQAVKGKELKVTGSNGTIELAQLEANELHKLLPGCIFETFERKLGGCVSKAADVAYSKTPGVNWDTVVARIAGSEFVPYISTFDKNTNVLFTLPAPLRDVGVDYGVTEDMRALLGVHSREANLALIIQSPSLVKVSLGKLYPGSDMAGLNMTWSPKQAGFVVWSIVGKVTVPKVELEKCLATLPSDAVADLNKQFKKCLVDAGIPITQHMGPTPTGTQSVTPTAIPPAALTKASNKISPIRVVEF